VIDDPLLPVATHLVGDDGRDLLEVAVTSAGGTLLDARLVQVQHRPGHDLVARFEATVSWAGAPPRAETLLAGSTQRGAPDGTLPLEADGLQAGVWRYPFDPKLPGLDTAVTPGRLARVLDPITGPRPRLDVVAYRPMRRAVVRATGADGRNAYVKVVRPTELKGIVDDHHRLLTAGLPVPEVLATDAEHGILVLAALAGHNLRDVLLGSTDGWPTARGHLALRDALAGVPGVPTSTSGAELGEAAASHAAAVAAVLPAAVPVLEHIVAVVRDLTSGPVADRVTVHGDLYEAQLMVDHGHIVGLLDLDDVGLGHPLDDLATTLAHLHLVRPATRRHRDHLRRYRTSLRAAFAERDRTGGRQLDLRTAAVLVGLATGPYRAQRHDWRAEARRRLRAAMCLVRQATSEGENTLMPASQQRHAHVRGSAHEVATAPHPPTEGAFPWH